MKNFDSLLRDAIVDKVLKMQDELLDKIREPRSISPIVTQVFEGKLYYSLDHTTWTPIDSESDKLLKATYISLLKSAIRTIEKEIEDVS